MQAVTLPCIGAVMQLQRSVWRQSGSLDPKAAESSGEAGAEAASDTQGVVLQMGPLIPTAEKERHSS